MVKDNDKRGRGPKLSRRRYVQGTAAAGLSGALAQDAAATEGGGGGSPSEDVGCEEFLERVRAGKPVLGMSTAFAGMDSTTVVANSPPVDWVWIDTEHGSYDIREVRQKIAVFPDDTASLVRVTGTSPKEVERTLDAGADGVIIPKRHTVEEVREYVRAAYYPPMGDRGVAGSIAAADYGLDFEEYYERANERVFVVVQIERQGLVENADELAQIEGVDCLMVSPADLSHALGDPFNTESAEFRRATDRVLRAATRHDVAPGYWIGADGDVSAYVNDGWRVLSLGSEAGLLASAIERRFPDRA